MDTALGRLSLGTVASCLGRGTPACALWGRWLGWCGTCRGLAYPSHPMGFNIPVTALFSVGWSPMLRLISRASSLCKGLVTPSFLRHLFPSWWFLCLWMEMVKALVLFLKPVNSVISLWDSLAPRWRGRGGARSVSALPAGPKTRQTAVTGLSASCCCRRVGLGVLQGRDARGLRWGEKGPECGSLCRGSVLSGGAWECLTEAGWRREESV